MDYGLFIKRSRLDKEFEEKMDKLNKARVKEEQEVKEEK
jgi:hypothetical protein